MTGNVRKLRVVLAPVAVAITLFAATGCGPTQATTAPPGGGTPTTGASTATTSASPSSRPSTNPTSPAPDVIEFSVDGAGPYLLGRTLTQLQTSPGLGSVDDSTTCAGNKAAHGVGVWQDVTLQFRADGKLYLAVNRSASIPTPSGAWLGTTLSDLKKIYASVSNEELTKDGKSALLVRTLSGQGILFTLNDDPTKTVETMVIADANYLRTQFTTAGPFC